ncbi:PEBP-like protein [Dendrothele bispora CBS 962.96]|uniref:PEBP-like protein n=1 Tax=Dendrothele bispora (strain CBS 962.96) TaxID=1314807 RepID=A0A4V4HB73_DENBC|nr:PEBP-like protein [Dendrothele bispora CBS 962.96]
MASLDPLSSIVTALKRELIIPEIIPESANFYPSVLFSVIYPSGREGILNTELTIEDALDEPEVNFTPMVASDEFTGDSTSNDSETSYTLVMTDPDAPSRANPTSKEFRHWVITGLKAPAQSSDKTGNLTALKTKPSTTPYRPPGPFPGSGLHRYTFLLFQEPPGFSLPPDAKEFGDSIPERRHWKAFEFGEKYGLKLVGANYFIVRAVDE